MKKTVNMKTKRCERSTPCLDIGKNDIKTQIAINWLSLKAEIQTFKHTYHNKFAVKEDMPYLLPTKE